MQVLEREYSDFDIDEIKWQSPKLFGISGCFRLKDESEFMVQAVESHLPYLDEAVLVVQPSKDNTVELARMLDEKHDKVRVVEYPVSPHFIDEPEFHTDPENSIYSFVYLSNYALSQCRYSWICKVEGDVVALSTTKRIVDLIHENKYRDMYYGRVILNVAGKDIDQVSWDNPRNGGWDEGFFPNDPRKVSFVKRAKWEVCESRIQNICMGFSALHMKRCKEEHLPVWNGERYVPYTKEWVKQALDNYNKTVSPYPAHDEADGAPCLFEPVPVLGLRC